MIPDAVRTLLDLSNVPTILLGGPDGVISYANPEALAVLGRPDEPTSGRSLEELSHHDDRQRLSQAVRECAGVHGARRYVRHRFLDQSRDVVSTDVALIGCGDWVGAGVSVLLEMRDLSITRSHNVFLRFLADVPPRGPRRIGIAARPAGPAAGGDPLDLLDQPGPFAGPLPRGDRVLERSTCRL